MVPFITCFVANSRDGGFKKGLFSQDRVVNSCTHRSYSGIAPPVKTYINDHTSNVIYVITYHKCELQYIGEIFHELNNRFN